LVISITIILTLFLIQVKSFLLAIYRIYWRASAWHSMFDVLATCRWSCWVF